MSVSGKTLRTSVCQSEATIYQSRHSFQTVLSSKVRNYDRHVFHQYYVKLCQHRNMLPLACSKIQNEQGLLDFNADRIKLNHWGPLLTALYTDRSLQHIIIRSKHFRKKVVAEADTKMKALAVTHCPVLYTHYVLSLMMDTLAGCMLHSRALVSLELNSLPLDKKYIEPLMEGMKACPSLQHVSFQGCPMGDAGCEVVCTNLRNMPGITSLNLSQCCLSSSGAAHVANMIKYQKIHRLSECWKHTLRYREANLDAIQGIRRVTLNNNPIQDEGLSCIVDAVTDDLWVKALDLHGCGLSNTGASRVLELLEYNTSLAIVDLRLNTGISADMLARIMRKLHDNNAHHDPQWGWFPVATKQLSKKSLTQTIASRFQLQLSRKTLSNLDEHHRCEQRKPPVPRARLKQHVSSCGQNPPPSLHASKHEDRKHLEEERDMALQERDAALAQLHDLQAELEHVRKERDEAFHTVNQLVGRQPHGAEGYTLVRQDLFAAMEAIIKILHKNGKITEGV